MNQNKNPNQTPAKDRYGRSGSEIKYPKTPTWCPGCGNYGIWAAIKQAIKQANLPRERIAIFYDVGCSGNMADFNDCYGFHTLHGRAIPSAVGAKLANHELKILSVIGDGGCYGEGGTHFINLMRGNHDVIVLVHNNHRYSLTTGQMSPTTEKGVKTKSTPEGTIEEPLNPIALALVNHATFIAREFAGDIPLLASRINEALNHTGFALIDILQPCVVFNPQQSYEWYREHMVKLSEEGHDSQNRELALNQALRTDKLATGLFYQESKPAYHQEVSELQKNPLTKHPIDSVDIAFVVEDLK
jgi:2-oxoglutarate ferredoxin oxidoreductase subunit beta